MSTRDDDPLGLLFNEVRDPPQLPAEQRLCDYLAPLDARYGADPMKMQALRRRYAPLMVCKRMHPVMAALYYRGLMSTDAAWEGLQADINAAQDLPPFDWRTDPLPE